MHNLTYRVSWKDNDMDNDSNNDSHAKLSGVLDALRHLEYAIQETQAVPEPVFMVMSATALRIMQEYPPSMFDEHERDLIATIVCRAVDMDFTNA